MKIGQSKAHSILEALVNVAIGFGVALASQLVIFSLYGIQIPFSTNIEITLWFTLVSIIRSYGVRRLFNWYHLQGKKHGEQTEYPRGERGRGRP